MTGAEVEYAAMSGVPGPTARKRDVHVVLI
jgi:hypothetical protein